MPFLAETLAQFRTSFRFKLLLIFTVSTILITLGVLLLLISYEYTTFQRQGTERARLLASLVASNVRLPLYSENKELLANHARAALETSPRIYRVTISNVAEKTMAEATSVTADSSATFLSYRAPVTSLAGSATDIVGSGVEPPALLGYVTVQVDVGDLRDTILTAILMAAAILAVFWLLITLMSYPLLIRITESFNALTNGIDTVAGGDYSFRISPVRDDEAGRAADAVNRLAQTLEQRERENKELQQDVIAAMKVEVRQEQEKMMAKLIQANKMTSLGLLISSMTHNISTPNGAIRLASQHLARSWQDSLPLLHELAEDEGNFMLGGLPFDEAKEEISRCFDTIERGSERIARIIQDLRSYSLGERNGVVTDVSIAQVVEGALTIIRAYGKNSAISVTHALDATLPVVTGNANQLEQVVVNLLLNAMQSVVDEKSGRVHVSDEYHGESGTLRVVITDNGQGIPEYLLPHVFDPFFSTRLDQGGSGLGLYISQFIMNEHGGTLEFSTKVGKGTSVTMILPVSSLHVASSSP